MPELLLQFLVTGITVGSLYALVGLGFALIYNASDVVNFAQGEFVMLGAMTAIALLNAGMPLLLAAIIATSLTVLVGLLLERFAIEPAAGASVVTTIIITIGAAIFLRGVALLLWGKDFHALPPFSGEAPIRLGGATVLPQSLWVLGVTVALVLLVRVFLNRTLLGKALLACSFNRTAAQAVGINVKAMLRLAYGLSAGLGALAGILIAPITFSSYEAGVMLGLKGFSAAIVGGIGNPMGAVAGGLLLGVLEALGAGLVSSGYKDAIAFLFVLMVLFFEPTGLFGHKAAERV
ncbi:Inner-membrane translocator [Candidatus Competibacter denitrificans Run_A_D11]|uniref:Inner-membrane translocator n=1 Tax=Candidatus Competibacter denitrificans Run_A_D11 TaxID=1400863 RepID=W6MBT8_9GAMM|nr:branched-chain amino acid ABC transporter permease [Candidatus Competibacter denitrificans]CDI03655.1 Inner-membrane translocator [Candidatus Competibacter denitrificans Run_A_D11]HAS87135.1 branched-chain amino acid ABC transporter permease [Candidatus Competibacteraceae bacterium]HRC68335.1 branched-chain amino acid ABC transporter permease [Candidatus Competibacter denitrificans]